MTENKVGSVTTRTQQAQVSGYVVCPYCDPNYKPYPNVDESCRGYDVPMGNPIPAQGKTDPG